MHAVPYYENINLSSVEAFFLIDDVCDITRQLLHVFEISELQYYTDASSYSQQFKQISFPVKCDPKQQHV